MNCFIFFSWLIASQDEPENLDRICWMFELSRKSFLNQKAEVQKVKEKERKDARDLKKKNRELEKKIKELEKVSSGDIDMDQALQVSFKSN